MAALPSTRFRRAALLALGLGFAISAQVAASAASAAPLEPVHSLAAREKAPLLETLKGLVSIESGSGDREGLDRISGRDREAGSARSVARSR